MNKKETGITLIALVVTIIVLLILAGVTLSIAIDNGGIIGRARNAKETYRQAEENDAKALESIDNFLEEEIGKQPIVEYERNGKFYITVNGQEYVRRENPDDDLPYWYRKYQDENMKTVYQIHPSRDPNCSVDAYSSDGEFLESQVIG